MATALSMIKRAMRLATVLGKGETPDDDESADGLEALNAMLDSWSTERLMVYQVQQDDYSWAANEASRTIGSGGNFNTTRPTKVAEEGNFFRDSSNSLDYSLGWIGDRSSYDRIVLKSTTSSYPEWLFVDMGYPLATIYVWPVPTQTLTLYLNTWKPLQSFSSLTDELALPPGYKNAIEHNLAVEFGGGEFGAPVPASVIQRATLYKTNLKTINRPDLVSRIDPALLGRGLPYNIYSDS